MFCDFANVYHKYRQSSELGEGGKCRSANMYTIGDNKMC